MYIYLIHILIFFNYHYNNINELKYHYQITNFLSVLSFLFHNYRRLILSLKSIFLYKESNFFNQKSFLNIFKNAIYTHLNLYITFIIYRNLYIIEVKNCCKIYILIFTFLPHFLND